jgi:hypothetical protein
MNHSLSMKQCSLSIWIILRGDRNGHWPERDVVEVALLQRFDCVCQPSSASFRRWRKQTCRVERSERADLFYSRGNKKFVFSVDSVVSVNWKILIWNSITSIMLVSKLFSNGNVTHQVLLLHAVNVRSDNGEVLHALRRRRIRNINRSLAKCNRKVRRWAERDGKIK